MDTMVKHGRWDGDIEKMNNIDEMQMEMRTHGEMEFGWMQVGDEVAAHRKSSKTVSVRWMNSKIWNGSKRKVKQGMAEIEWDRHHSGRTEEDGALVCSVEEEDGCGVGDHGEEQPWAFQEDETQRGREDADVYDAGLEWVGGQPWMVRAVLHAGEEDYKGAAAKVWAYWFGTFHGVMEVAGLSMER